MTDAPGSDTFPYVQECPNCDGSAFKIVYEDRATQRVYTWGDSGEPVRTMQPWQHVTCKICDGIGRIIPPEWTGTQP